MLESSGRCNFITDTTSHYSACLQMPLLTWPTSVTVCLICCDRLECLSAVEQVSKCLERVMASDYITVRPVLAEPEVETQPESAHPSGNGHTSQSGDNHASDPERPPSQVCHLSKTRLCPLSVMLVHMLIMQNKPPRWPSAERCNCLLTGMHCLHMVVSQSCMTVIFFLFDIVLLPLQFSCKLS